MSGPTTYSEHGFESEALRRLVRPAWSLSYEAVHGPLPGLIAPDAHVEFVFQTGAPCAVSTAGNAETSPRAMIHALRHGMTRLTADGANTIVAFRATPVVATAILGRPLNECWDRPIALDALIGSGGEAVADQLAEARDTERGAIIEAWLASRLHDWSGEHVRQAGIERALMRAERSLAAFAEDAGVTLRTLRRHAERYAGLSPKQLAMSGRILRACGRLQDRRDEPIAAVAQHMGFGDQAAFTNAFRRYTGMTPALFRAEPLVFCERL